MSGKPLTGLRIMVTRDARQAGEFIRLIETGGAEVISVPMIQITGPEDWNMVDSEIARLETYDWIMYTSINAAEYFLDRLRQKGKNLQHIQVAAISEKVAKFVRQGGEIVHLVPDQWNAAGMLRSFEGIDLNGKNILLPVSDIAGMDLQNGLEHRNAQVTHVVVYRTIAGSNVPVGCIRKSLENREIDCITFFSPSAFHYFIDILGSDMIDVIRSRKIILASIGATTRQAIEDYGLEVDIQPHQSTGREMVNELIRYYQQEQPELRI